MNNTQEEEQNSWLRMLTPVNLAGNLPAIKKAKKVIGRTSMQRRYQYDHALNKDVIKTNKRKLILQLCSQGKDLTEIAMLAETTKAHVRAVLIENRKINKIKWHGGRKPRPVNQLTLDGKFLTKFDSIADASYALRINKENIRLVCKGVRATAGGYKFEWNEEPRSSVVSSKCVSPRKNIKIRYGGLSMRELAAKLGVDLLIVKKRRDRGWTEAEMLAGERQRNITKNSR